MAKRGGSKDVVDLIERGAVDPDALDVVPLHLRRRALVVRLEGTNVEKGKEILNGSGLDIIAASDLDDAAQKIVEATQKSSAAA